MGRPRVDMFGNLVCRPATRDDYHAITGMGDVLEGLDDLAHMYNHFMEHPDVFYCFVLEVDAKVVGFVYYHITGDGDSVVTGPVRVHRHYRGHHILAKLSEYGASQVMRIHPRAFHKYLFTAFSSNFQRQRLVNFPDKYKLLVKRKLKSMCASMDTIKGALLSPASPMPHHSLLNRPSKEEFTKNLPQADTLKYLFPDRYVIVSWRTYDVQSSCLDYLYDNHEVVCTRTAPHSKQDVTDESTGEQQELCDTPAEQRLRPRYSALGCMTAIPCQAGLRLDVDFYGRDQSLLRDYLLLSLQHVLEKYRQFSGDLHLVLYHPLDFTLNSEDILADVVLWQKGAWDRYDEYILVHSQFEPSPEEKPKSADLHNDGELQ